MKSKLFTLDWRDLANGLLIAFLAAMIDGIIKILGSGAVFDWPHLQPVLIAGISAALYLCNYNNPDPWSLNGGRFKNAWSFQYFYYKTICTDFRYTHNR